MKILLGAVALATISLFSNLSVAQADEEEFVDGFLIAFDNALNSTSVSDYWNIDLSEAEYYIDNGLLPVDFDWEAAFVVLSQPPGKASSADCVGASCVKVAPAEFDFFERANIVKTGLWKIRRLDLSRQDLPCVKRARGVLGQDFLSASRETIERFPANCGLLEISYLGIEKAEDIKWLEKNKVDLNSTGNDGHPGILQLYILKGLVPQAVTSNSPTSSRFNLDRLVKSAANVDFDVDYGTTASNLVKPALRSQLPNEASIQYSDVVTSLINFGDDPKILEAYCRIADENLFSSYQPRHLVLPYFFSYDEYFVRALQLGRVQDGSSCFRFLKELTNNNPDEFPALQKAALKSGQVDFIKLFEKMFF